ncbi:hypothetical protein TNCV_2709511 [Trichonephila clavipes]|nr:hypothetical protein TNCV_2709511 [Trichonephila clavipes]
MACRSPRLFPCTPGASPIALVLNDGSPPSCLSPSEVDVVFRKFLGGFPQGSVLSPTPWNIYFNPILSLNSELFLLQAFADDLTVVSFGLSLRELEDNTNEILCVAFRV